MASQGEEEVRLEYWLRWQVPVCALIFLLPSVIAVRLLKRVNRVPLKSTDLWITCWRNLNPLWLLFFRAFAFASMAFVLYQVVVFLGGAFAFYFYTQWTFALVTVYFALATIISARGCYSKKPFPESGQSREFLKKDSDVISSSSKSAAAAASSSDDAKESRYNNNNSQQEEIDELKAGFLDHLLQAIYLTCAGAVMLTDIVFWCLLLPFLLGEQFQLTLLIGCIHSLNAVFLIIDSALNSQPFPWYGLAYFVLWSVSYVIFQWVLHACGFTWWPYPFLDLSTPWAPIWYFALALVHLPSYGIYVLLIKAKGWIFPRMFPTSFVRRTGLNTTRRNSLDKKQT